MTEERIAQMMEALKRSKRLFDEALPKFNWGASFLDGNAIELLNTVPAEVGKAIADAQDEFIEQEFLRANKRH
jgi:ribosome biogenesis protein Tsr3